MNEIELRQATEETVVRLLRATRANDTESAPRRHSQQTDRCPPIGRFNTVFRCGGAWSPAEQAHVEGCPFCDRVRLMFTRAADAGAEEKTVRIVAATEETAVTGGKRAKPADPPGEPPVG